MATASTPPTAADPLRLRPRLLVQGGGFALLLLLAFAAALYWGIAAEREEDLRRRVGQLAVAASGQLPLLVHEFHEVSNARKFREDGEVVEGPDGGEQRVRWFDAAGQLVHQQGQLPLPPSPPAVDRRQVRWQRWAGGLRLWQPVLTRHRGSAGAARLSGYVEVGLSDRDLDLELARLRRGLLLGTLCAALAALAAGRGVLRRAVAPLQVQVAALQRFTADASHELRHPLTLIRTLVAGAAPEPASRELLARIDGVAGRMGLLLDDLLMLARHDQGLGEGRQRRQRWRRFDLLELLEDLCSRQAAMLPSGRQLSLLLEAGGLAVLPVEGQPEQLERLFTNLLINAVRHSPDRGCVRLSVARQGGRVWVRVCDQGEGIDPTLQEQVFERFWQGGSGGRVDEGSSGLGLAIARAIARAHGGELRVADGRAGHCVLEVQLQAAPPGDGRSSA